MKYMETRKAGRNCRLSRGLSLVEIIIGLTILVMSAVFFNKFIIGTQRGIEFTEKHLRAYLLADHLISTLQVKSECALKSEFTSLLSGFGTKTSVIEGGKFEPKLCDMMNTVTFSKEAAEDYKTFAYEIQFQGSPATTIDTTDVSDFYRPATIFVLWSEKGSEKKIGINTAFYVKR